MMMKRSLLFFVLCSVVAMSLYLLRDNLFEIEEIPEINTKLIKPGSENKKNLNKKYNMYIATGNPRIFETEKEVAEAKSILNRRVSASHYAVVGHFDKLDKSNAVENERYPGGGYYPIDFIVTDVLKKYEPVDPRIKIRVPYDFAKLDDQRFVSEIRTNMHNLLRESMAFEKKFESDEVTSNELEIFNAEWEEKVRKMQYVFHFDERMRRGENFSLSNTEFVLFLRSGNDDTYAFNPNDIYPIGFGLFVDVLLR